MNRPYTLAVAGTGSVTLQRQRALHGYGVLYGYMYYMGRCTLQWAIEDDVSTT